MNSAGSKAEIGAPKHHHGFNPHPVASTCRAFGAFGRSYSHWFFRQESWPARCPQSCYFGRFGGLHTLCTRAALGGTRWRTIQRHRVRMDARGRPAHGNRLFDRRPDGIDDVCSDLRVADGAHLHHRLYGRRPGLSALFQLYLTLYVCDADARYEQQLSAALFWLGSGRFSQLPFDRLLVQKAERSVCQYEGLPHQSSG